MRELIANMFVSLDDHAYAEGAPPYFGCPDVSLEFAGTDVLDGRLVRHEYRQAAAE